MEPRQTESRPEPPPEPTSLEKYRLQPGLSADERNGAASRAEFVARARRAAALAERADDPAESFLSGPSEALVGELYRQSIHWLSRAQGAGGEHLSGSLFRGEDAALLERVSHDLAPRSFVDFAEPSLAARRTRARELRQIVVQLLARAHATGSEDGRGIWSRARGRWLFAALVLVLGAGALVAAVNTGETDLAAGRPWRTSSTEEDVGCRSPEQSCAESPGFFFHSTDEDKPWIQIDLGLPQRIGEVQVDNRSDCCADRAVPLLIEVGTDPRRLRQVHRRDEPFVSWRAEFTPTIARYVRVRAARRTVLHLSRIRVFSR